MPDMSKRCPRCGSEERGERDYSLKRETYKFMGETKEYHVATKTYKCNDCRLIYTQEE